MSTHNMFLWRTGENYPRIITKYSFLTIPVIIKINYYKLVDVCCCLVIFNSTRYQRHMKEATDVLFTVRVQKLFHSVKKPIELNAFPCSQKENNNKK